MRTLAKGTTRGFLALFVGLLVACSGDDGTPEASRATEEAPTASSEPSPSVEPTQDRVVEIESGEALDDDVVTRLVTGTLERIDGQWGGGRGLVRSKLVRSAVPVAQRFVQDHATLGRDADDHAAAAAGLAKQRPDR